jgi:hypothetical protein
MLQLIMHWPLLLLFPHCAEKAQIVPGDPSPHSSLAPA